MFAEQPMNRLIYHTTTCLNLLLLQLKTQHICSACVIYFSLMLFSCLSPPTQFNALVAMEIRSLGSQRQRVQFCSTRLCVDSDTLTSGIAEHTKSWIHIQNGKPVHWRCVLLCSSEAKKEQEDETFPKASNTQHLHIFFYVITMDQMKFFYDFA